MSCVGIEIFLQSSTELLNKSRVSRRKERRRGNFFEPNYVNHNVNRVTSEMRKGDHKSPSRVELQAPIDSQEGATGSVRKDVPRVIMCDIRDCFVVAFL